MLLYRRIDDDMRAAMAIDWIAREKENPGKKQKWILSTDTPPPIVLI